MHCLPYLLATLVCVFFFLGNAAILPPVFPEYHIELKLFKTCGEGGASKFLFRAPTTQATALMVANKEIHLKHGKLHPHEDFEVAEDDEHIVYRYRWLGDDIVKTEGDFEGEIDEEYTDKEKKIKLPGGCELTENQFLELESFKKETYYVKKCYCEQGGVYCQLNRTFFKDNLI